jgi:hypothetical protein
MDPRPATSNIRLQSFMSDCRTFIPTPNYNYARASQVKGRFFIYVFLRILGFSAPVDARTLTRLSPSWQADRKENGGKFPDGHGTRLEKFYLGLRYALSRAGRAARRENPGGASSAPTKNEPRQAPGLRG